MARHLYIDAVVGDDANSGLASDTPCLTWAGLVAAQTLADNDTVHISGVLRESAVIAGVRSNLTITSDDGKGGFTGARLIANGSCVQVSGNHYSISIGLGKSVRGLVVNYDAQTSMGDWLDRHYGHEPLAASAAALNAARGYFYDGATGLLHFNIGSAPGVKVVEWCELVDSGLSFTGLLTSCAVKNLRFRLFIRTVADGQKGNGIDVQGGAIFCGFQNLRLDDCGNHSLVFRDAAQLVGNATVGCQFSGISPSGILLTHHTSGDDQVRNQVWRCQFEAHTPLGSDAEPMAGNTGSAGGAFSHTNGTTFDGVEYFDCDFGSCGGTMVARQGGANLACGNNSAPSDPRDSGTYSIRAHRCRNIQRRAFDISQIGYINSSLKFTAGLAAESNAFTAANGFTLTFGAFGSVIECNFDAVTDPCQVFRLVDGTVTLVLQNSTVIDTTAAAATQVYMLYSPGGTHVAYWNGNILGHLSNGGAGARGLTYTVGHTTFHVQDNQYLKIDAGTWSDDAAKDTAAEWAAVVDTGTATLAASQFVSAADFNLTLAGQMTKLPGTFTPRISFGINDKPFAHNYGAYQYGSCPDGRGRSRGRGR